MKTTHASKPKSSEGLTALHPAGLYRLQQFIPSIIGIGKTRWWAGVRAGEFPQPAVRRSKRLTLWRGRDVLAALDRLASAQ